MKKIIILGATGSIGQRTLDVIRDFPHEFEVVGLSTFGNIELLKQQIAEFRPAAVAIADSARKDSAHDITFEYGCNVYFGTEGLCELVAGSKADMVVISTVGVVGLLPTLTAIDEEMTIALANKEVLVAGGDLVMERARERNVAILPVDSEHSAVFQCLAGQPSNNVYRIILTASGGPFRETNYEELVHVQVEEALEHPTWSMGRKITIDSATLMNKGFEIIECHHFFNTPMAQISVVVHRQSIIHSMVEFNDGSVLAQLGITDMYLPIQIALSWPERWDNELPRLDFYTLKELTFEPPDLKKFPCLQFAYDAVKIRGTMPAVLNAANEIAVKRFLDREIPFMGIPETIRTVMEKHNPVASPGLSDILEADTLAREEALRYEP